MDSLRIEWNGQLVGHIEDLGLDTFVPSIDKYRGRWVPLRTQVAQDFLRQCEEHSHVEVGTPGRPRLAPRGPVPGQKVLFRLGDNDEAWLLFYTYDTDKFFSHLGKLSQQNKEDDSV